jgi:hypothetical protein
MPYPNPVAFHEDADDIESIRFGWPSKPVDPN